MLISTKLINKVRRIADTYTPLIFEPLAEVPVRYCETRDHWREVPANWAAWPVAQKGTPWGEPWGNAWFVGEAVIPKSAAGKRLYIRAQTDGCESLFWVDGVPKGIFAHPKEAAQRGGHHTLLLTDRAVAGRSHVIAMESYAGHSVAGSMPLRADVNPEALSLRLPRVFERVALMRRDELVKDFVFDLRALCQLVEALPETSFRRARLCAVFEELFKVAVQDPEWADRDQWRQGVCQARELLAPELAVRNSASAPYAGIIGHSHLDTAWTWPIDETIRKAARTYSNALSLMDQYPEFLFIQSSSYHAELMRRHYPAIFEGIKQRVREGRWEPNGGAWIECDCNMAGGEPIIRQFMKGQAYTQAHFGYRSDVFWLPDTFGYSASLPQILLGCGLRYFLTTKLTWNDTNTFPFDTFQWEGLDGSKVLTHFNDIHCWPDPATLITKVHGGPKDFRTVENYIQHKEVNNRRLISFGFGDGGGGPQFEMLEMARRCRDLDGCPRAEYTTVSRFMRELETSSTKLPTYSGELYFEGHRGTLTQMGGIKRGNRKCELALREAEFLASAAALSGRAPRTAEIGALYDVLLINQFHDILPGTSIPEVHDRALREFAEVETSARALCGELGGGPGDESAWTVWNSLGWERKGPLALKGLPAGMAVAAPKVTCQAVEEIGGEPLLLTEGLELPALGGVVIKAAAAPAAPGSKFAYREKLLETPFYRVQFDEHGYMASLYDKRNGRELRGGGLPLNAFLLGEDVPEVWDNWDIDADQSLKMELQTRRVEHGVAADGPLCLRLRGVYEIGRASRIEQDMVFYAGTPRIDFDTRVQWHEKHQLLKVGFDLNIRARFARHEIQFGHVLRSTAKNHSYDQAMFEVCNHKWTDLSEPQYGAAILNDCKYGISVKGSDLRLTLLKSGCHPDPRGDAGEHRFSYALLPHAGGFSAASVVRPAYEFNAAVTLARGGRPFASLCAVSAPNVVCETVKPAEDGDGVILRFYEAEGSRCRARVRFSQPFRKLVRTNLIEENLEELAGEEAELEFAPFQIITLRAVR